MGLLIVISSMILVKVRLSREEEGSSFILTGRGVGDGGVFMVRLFLFLMEEV